MIPVTIFAARKVAVFGLGLSGLATAKALAAGGAEPALWDDSEKGREGARAAGFVPVDLTSADWSEFAALVLAPGVPLTHPEPHWTVVRAKGAGIEFSGDAGVGGRRRRAGGGRRVAACGFRAGPLAAIAAAIAGSVSAAIAVAETAIVAASDEGVDDADRRANGRVASIVVVVAADVAIPDPHAAVPAAAIAKSAVAAVADKLDIAGLGHGLRVRRKRQGGGAAGKGEAKRARGKGERNCFHGRIPIGRRPRRPRPDVGSARQIYVARYDGVHARRKCLRTVA
jgi:hypothetical protein